MALWLKFGLAAAVELMAASTICRFGCWQQSTTVPQAPWAISRPNAVNAHVVGVRVYMRSSSDQVRDKSVAAPLSFSRARTFMLPQFARQGWVL